MGNKALRVVWFQAASCTGCTISILNSSSFKVKNLLLDEIVPGHHLCLLFQQTIMAGSGEKVLEVLREQGTRKDFFLVVEGSIPTKDSGIYGKLGEKTMLEWFGQLASACSGIISLGTCSSFGGMFAAAPNPAGCKSVRDVCKTLKVEKPIINIPGCPPHPDWFIGTIVHLLNRGIPALDDVSRPLDFYGGLIHENCPRRPYFDKGKFAYKFGEEGCLYLLGCKGPFTNSDCPLRQWNGGINWLIKNGAPCFGCVEPDFPEKMVPFFEKPKDNKT
ncbi:MAG: hydrogenase small subunit [Candidatus Omnitrophica bacterium]|nr:hydrogenase small subunit [Candidatus Omnitrophota bacterium]